MILNDCKTVCFVGNSITEGSANGFHGWYEPLKGLLPTVEFKNVSKGGKTTKYFVSISDSIAKTKCDCYVISIGCNDIRYRNPEICSMDTLEYITNIDKLVNDIKKVVPQASFIFIAPWLNAHHKDPLCPQSLVEEEELYTEFCNSLCNYCKAKEFLYVNPNPYIRDMIFKNGWNYYMLDHVHPNEIEGIKLYSKAVVLCSK